jgi:hypothetical protein
VRRYTTAAITKDKITAESRLFAAAIPVKKINQLNNSTPIATKLMAPKLLLEFLYRFQGESF